MSDDIPVGKKSLGQHWLNDSQALNDIADSADINREDTVLEIGPGTGTLTRVLAQRAGQVIAVELDDNLVANLVHQQIANNLQFVKGSILDFDLSELPVGYKVVANIPYYLTSKLIRVLSESINPPTLAVLLVQKEVAQRITAGPGKMSMLSVSAQYYFETELGREVPRNLFTPPPKVDSQVIILKHRTQPLFPGYDPGKREIGEFFRIVKAGFSNRRKTLVNSLSGGLQQSKTVVSDAIVLAGLLPGTRPQELSIADWYELYKQLNKHRDHFPA